MLSNYIKNGVSFEFDSPDPVPVLPSKNTVAIVGTAPESMLEKDVPHIVSNASELKTLGESGTLYDSLSYAFLSGYFKCYVVIVDSVEDESAQMALVAGKSEDKTGVYAILRASEKPTLILAPGFGHDGSVRNALEAVSGRVFCRYLSETTSENEKKSKADAKGRSSDREYLIDNRARYFRGGGEVSLHPSAAALPAFVARAPWESPEGISLKLSSLAREIEYQPLAEAGTTESDRLNSVGVSNLVRGTRKPFLLKGNRATSGRFISHTGVQDHVMRLIALEMEDNLGRNLTKSFISNLINRLNSSLAVVALEGGLEKVSIELADDRNSSASLDAGRWYLRIKYEHYAVNENPVVILTASTAALEAE